MLTLDVKTPRWPLRIPFRIAGQTMEDVPVIHVRLRDKNGVSGHAEAAGIDYDGETPASMGAQLHAITSSLHDDISAPELLTLLPRGGARNALDCALLDLRAKQQKTTVAAQFNFGCNPLLCVYTIGMSDKNELHEQLAIAKHYQHIKIKVDGHDGLERVREIRHALPDKTIMVDANQSWTVAQLQQWQPSLRELGVNLIEQPLPRGHDEALRYCQRLLPVAADESCTDRHSLAALVGKYDLINIKLDKCGGLSEALTMVQMAQQLNLRLMVGNMCGSSLAMAPAFYIGQYCEVVDLDGPLLQSDDIQPAMRFEQGQIFAPEPALWG